MKLNDFKVGDKAMNKFKIGDEVAVYDGHRTEGKIVAVSGELVKLKKKSDYFYWYHYKQCRKLVKKKVMELDVEFKNDNGWMYPVPFPYLQHELANKKFHMTLKEIK